MSWEAWGAPPDPDPGPEPDPPLFAPAIGARQQWCCARGCGACAVKTVQRETSRTTCLRTGKVTNRQFQTEDVSSCCGADGPSVYSEISEDHAIKDARHRWNSRMVARSKTPNAKLTGPSESQGSNDEHH